MFRKHALFGQNTFFERNCMKISCNASVALYYLKINPELYYNVCDWQVMLYRYYICILCNPCVCAVNRVYWSVACFAYTCVRRLMVKKFRISPHHTIKQLKRTGIQIYHMINEFPYNVKWIWKKLNNIYYCYVLSIRNFVIRF